MDCDSKRLRAIRKRLDERRDYLPSRWAYLHWRGSGRELVDLPEGENEYYLFDHYGCDNVSLDVTPTDDEVAKWRKEYEEDLRWDEDYQDLHYLLCWAERWRGK